MTTVQRSTSETRIHASISDDFTLTSIDTSIPFLDHMLHTLARYSGLGVVVEARGDLRHHIAEDVAICLGKALSSFATETCARYGDRTIPMDDALVQCVLDLGGRPYYRGPLPNRLYDHWLRSFSDNAGATIHLRVIRGRDRHHIIEAAFKALGLALADALRDTDAVFSTKGSAVVEVEP
jgi:imidazoleglycerol-phosphate dehydratase